MKPIYRVLFVLLVLLVTTCCGRVPPATPFEPAGSTDTPPAMSTASLPTVFSTQPPGGISGHLSYPSEFIPELRVVAFNASDAGIFYYVDTVQNQNTYRIDNIPAGTYHVLAYGLDPAYNVTGGYTQAVPCGLQAGCNDHTLIDVVVLSGALTGNINPNDWYAPAGAFPPLPKP